MVTEGKNRDGTINKKYGFIGRNHAFVGCIDVFMAAKCILLNFYGGG